MGARLNNLTSAIKQAYPAATKTGSVIEEAAVLDEAFEVTAAPFRGLTAAYYPSRTWYWKWDTPSSSPTETPI